MSLFSDTKKESYRAQRQTSQGAGITLVNGIGCYHATFECATRIAAILGNRGLSDAGDGLYESIPRYIIPLEELNEALLKLSQKYSVALIDLASDTPTRFVLVWRIVPFARLTDIPEPPQPLTYNLDDF